MPQVYLISVAEPRSTKDERNGGDFKICTYSELDVVACVYNPNTTEVEGGGSGKEAPQSSRPFWKSIANVNSLKLWRPTQELYKVRLSTISSRSAAERRLWGSRLAEGVHACNGCWEIFLLQCCNLWQTVPISVTSIHSWIATTKISGNKESNIKVGGTLWGRAELGKWTNRRGKLKVKTNKIQYGRVWNYLSPDPRASTPYILASGHPHAQTQTIVHTPIYQHTK